MRLAPDGLARGTSPLRNVRFASRVCAARLCIAVAIIAAWKNVAAPLRAHDNLIAQFPMGFCGERPRRLLIPVTIARGEYNFDIDTGLTRSIFDVRLRPLLGRPHGSALGRTALGYMRLDKYRGPRVYVAGERLPLLNPVGCHDVNVMEGSKGTVLGGILGVDALRGFVVQLDFDNGAIRMLRNAPTDSGERLRLVLPDTVPLIVARLGSRERCFQLDTGFSGELTLMKSDFDSLVERGDLLPAGAGVFAALSGEAPSRQATLKVPFGVGSHTHRALVVCEIPDGDLPDAPTAIGLGYLCRYLVTFDFPNNAVYLKPGASFRALMPSIDLFGVRLARDQKNDVVILSIAPDSRASKWGCVGNVVETINGAPASAMSDAEIVQRLTDRTQERLVNFRRPSDGWKSWMKLYAVPGASPAVNPGVDQVEGNARSQEERATPGDRVN